MYCHNCGNVIAPGTQFCPVCGTKLIVVQDKHPAKRLNIGSAGNSAQRPKVVAGRSQPQRPIKYLASGLCVLAFFAIACIFFLRRSDASHIELPGGTSDDVPTATNFPSASSGLFDRPATDNPESTPSPTALAADSSSGENTTQTYVEPDSSNQSIVEQDSSTMITLPGGTLAPASDFIFPYSGTLWLTTADLDNALTDMDNAVAALKSQQAINEIYARYGYRFHPELSDSAQWASDYFGALDWYNSIVNDNWSNTGEVPINEKESANIDLIVKWQANHGYR